MKGCICLLCILIALHINSVNSCEDVVRDESVFLTGVSYDKRHEGNECLSFTLLFIDRHPSQNKYLYSVHINVNDEKGGAVVDFKPGLEDVIFGYKKASFCLQEKYVDTTNIHIFSKFIGTAKINADEMAVLHSPMCFDIEAVSLKKAIQLYEKAPKKK